MESAAQAVIWQGMMLGALAMAWLVMLAGSVPREPIAVIYGRNVFVLLVLSSLAMIAVGLSAALA